MSQYSDNPRAISEYIHTIAPQIELIWVISKENKKYVPDYIKVVAPGSIISLKEMACADVWVLNTTYGLNDGYYKNHNQYYVQTWHGDRGFKKIAYAAAKAMGTKYSCASNLPQTKDCDLMVAGSDFGVKMLREAFNYNGEIINVGTPRNDKLVNAYDYQERITEIKQSIGIPQDTKILLYAPTFRDNLNDKQQCEIDIDEVYNLLNTDDEKWALLIRSHSNSKGINVNGKNFIDVTLYPDMADLLLISDILITDYSSSACDFVLTKRPVILVHFDSERFVKEIRTFWFNPEESGFLIAHNQLELNSIISEIYNYNHDKIAERIKYFYGEKESGNSAIIISEKIIEHLNS